MKLALPLIALLALPCAANTIGFQSTEQSNTFSVLQQFDPSLGTLDRIHFGFWYGGIGWDVISVSSPSALASVTATVLGTTMYHEQLIPNHNIHGLTMMSALATRDSYTVTPQGVDYPAHYDGSSFNFNDWIGTGEVTVPFSISLAILKGDAEIGNYLDPNLFHGGLSLAYDYTPYSQVLSLSQAEISVAPEPRTLAWGVIALLLLHICSLPPRRRRVVSIPVVPVGVKIHPTEAVGQLPAGRVVLGSIEL